MIAASNPEVIIVGGSYAGLSAAMALGRARRRVTIIDSGAPCNMQTPHSHNFITQDGQTPAAIHRVAKEQVLAYPTVNFIQGTVTTAVANDNGFLLTTEDGSTYQCAKILFATGVLNIMPELPGFSACWGISVIHCPYCHGYEYSDAPTGLLARGDMAFEFGRMISNWSADLTIFSDGPAGLSAEQLAKLAAHNINVVEDELQSLQHEGGYLQQVHCTNGLSYNISALYAKPAFVQHCPVPQELGCAITEDGYIKVDELKKTSVPGIFAAGDNTVMFRSVSYAAAAGTIAGAAINHELVKESF